MSFAFCFFFSFIHATLRTPITHSIRSTPKRIQTSAIQSLLFTALTSQESKEDMSNHCSSNISHHFQELLIADLFSFFSFIVSQPLYFAYLLFFLPYIVQFISFLCPLLLSSSLLFLLSLLTISPHEKPTRYGFLGNACRKVVNALETQPDDNVESHFFDPLSLIASELEACISLETVSYRGVEDDPVVEDLVEDSQTLAYNARKKLVEIPQENDELGISKRLDNLWGEHESGNVASGGLTNNFGENPIKVPQQNYELEASEQDQELKIPSIGSLGCKCNKSNMVVQGLTSIVGKYSNEIPQLKDELGAYEHQELKTTQGVTCKVGENYVQDIDTSGKENCNVMSLNPVGFGSMRKEKEWKRTLACKLYEERQLMESGEGMDLLWEVYEVDSGKAKEINKGKKEKMVKKKEVDMYEEEEEEEMNSQLCCLQALRFSTGRMNVGLGKLNSMRITKAFKGMGIFARREKKIF